MSNGESFETYKDTINDNTYLSSSKEHVFETYFKINIESNPFSTSRKRDNIAVDINYNERYNEKFKLVTIRLMKLPVNNNHSKTI